MAAPSGSQNDLSDDDMLMLSMSEPESQSPMSVDIPHGAPMVAPRMGGASAIRALPSHAMQTPLVGRDITRTEGPSPSLSDDLIRYGIPAASIMLGPQTGAAGIAGTLARALQTAGYFGAGDVVSKHLLGEPVNAAQTGQNMAIAGGGQIAGEAIPAIITRLGARLARIPPNVLKATREASGTAGPVSEQSYLMSKPPEMAERTLGQEVIQSTDEALGSLPQLRPEPQTADTMQAASDARAQAGKQAARVKAIESGRIVKASKETGTAAAQARSADNLADISSRIDDHLSQNERALTTERGTKVQMLKDAGDRGAKIDANGLLDSVDQMIDSLKGSAMSEDTAAMAELQRVRDTLTNLYGQGDVMTGGVGGGVTSANLRPLTPMEADQTLNMIQRQHAGAYGTVGQTLKDRLMGQLGRTWRQQFYDQMEGVGGVSAQIAKKMRAMSDLRAQMTTNPSGFGTRILSNSSGSREARQALAQYEEAFGTKGALQDQLDRFATDNADEIAGINKRHQQAADLVRSKRQAELADIDARQMREMEHIRRVRAMEQGKPREMFESQPSTPQQKATFEAADTLKSFMRDKTPESFVDSLWSGDEPAQSALQALRDFEKATGTNGSLENRLWRLHVRREWSGQSRAEALGLWRIFSRDIAKAGIVAQRPLGRVVATGAASAASSKENRQ